MISHDRYFLDRVADRVVEIVDGHGEFYSGNYSFYMDEKQARFDLQMKQYEQEQAKLKQLGFTLERMKGWGINNRTLYRRAMSIQHRMERIKKTEKPKTEKTMKATFGEKDFSGDVVFKLKNVSKAFDGRTLFSDVTLNVEGGERIALLGDNGTGKSTFIKTLTGVHQPDGGEIILNGEKVVMSDPIVAQKYGIAAIYQHAASYPDLSVAENIFIGHLAVLVNADHKDSSICVRMLWVSWSMRCFLKSTPFLPRQRWRLWASVRSICVCR